MLAIRPLLARGRQSVALFLLSVLAIAGGALGPMYAGAVGQAALTSTLGKAGIAERGLRITGASLADAAGYLPTGSARSRFDPAVSSVEADTYVHRGQLEFASVLTWRADECAHLRILDGRCPTGAGEVLFSAASAKALKLGVGSSYPITGKGGAGSYQVGIGRIVGLYDHFNEQSGFWFGHDYQFPGGIFLESRGDAVPDLPHPDAGFVSQAGITAIGRASGVASTATASPLRFAVELPVALGSLKRNDGSRLSAAVTQVQQRIGAAHSVGDPARGTLSTGLPALLDTAAAGSAQSSRIIPVLGAQLALVVLVVLGLVLAVSVDQRRPELAVARLRGLSRARTARFAMTETVVLVGSSLLPGLALAWLAGQTLASCFLPDGTSAPVRWPAFVAAVAVAGVELLVAVALARRAAREPIQALLRSVAARSSGWWLGISELAIGIAAAGGVAVVLTGDRSSGLALVVPGLLAVLAGMVASRLVGWFSRRAGRRQLLRGRLETAFAALQIARSTSFRRVLLLVCVAIALVTSTTDEWRVAQTARHGRAAAEIGAPVVLTVAANNVTSLQTAVSRADPDGRYATPVVVQTPAGGDSPLIAVDRNFGRIATWGSPRDTPSQPVLAAVVPSNAPAPIAVRGNLLTAELASVRFRRLEDSTAAIGPVRLRFVLRLPTGATTSVEVPLSSTSASSSSPGSASAPGSVSAPVGGCADGCALSQLQVLRQAGDFTALRITVVLTALQIGNAAAGTSVPLGSAADWGNVAGAAAVAAGTADPIALTPAGSGATVVTDSHGNAAALQHLDVPIAPSCLLTGDKLAADGKTGTVGVHGISGDSLQCAPAGRLPLLPRIGADGALVDLTLAARAGATTLTQSSAQVWLAADDPSRERILTGAITRSGLRVLARDSTKSRASAYDNAAPAWALLLAAVVAAGTALVAALMFLLVAAASRRTRGPDLAALRLVGVPARVVRRSVLLEQLGAVAIGVPLGLVIGLLGGRLALPAIPFFVQPAAVPRPVLAPDLTAVLIAVLCVAVVLLAAAVAAARLLNRSGGEVRR